jgi:hypothetical protein
LNKRVLAILAAIVIAAGIGGYLLFQSSSIQPLQTTEIVQTTQTTQVTQTPQSIPKVGTVTIKAIDQNNNKELVANVTVEGKDFKGETPYTLVLPYGVYTFILKYQDLEVKKTIEVNKPTQEVIVQFNIRTQTIKAVLDITADELIAKIEKAYKLKEEGKLNEAKELEDWLLSLKNKTVRITGKIEVREGFEGSPIQKHPWGTTSLYFGKVVDYIPIVIEATGNSSLVKDVKYGDIVTITGIVKGIYPQIGYPINTPCEITIEKIEIKK